MKTYEAVFNPEVNKGVYGISLVENPAMEGTFIALNEVKEIVLKADNEKRILTGLVLEPNKPIYRNQDGEEFNIVFSEQTIQDLQQHFFKNQYQKNSTIEHIGDMVDGVYFFESWTVANPNNDKSNELGFNVPKGSLMMSMKVDSDEVWNDYVKTGKVKGFSIDSLLSLKEVNFKSELNMNEQKSFLDEFKDLCKDLKMAFTPKQTDVKLGTQKTEDGSLTIYFDGEMMSVGASVWTEAEDGTQVPLPAGDYPLETNLILVVKEDGVVDSFIEKGKEEQPAEMTSEPTQDANVLSEINSAIKSILVKYSSVEAMLKEQAEELKSLKQEQVELASQPASKPIKSAPSQNVDLSKMSKKERIMYNINQLK